MEIYLTRGETRGGRPTLKENISAQVEEERSGEPRLTVLHWVAKQLIGGWFFNVPTSVVKNIDISIFFQY